MEQTQSALNIDQRPSVDRSDLETQTILFRQHVEGLLKQNSDRLRQICSDKGVIGDSATELVDGLVQLFANEPHYKRRNKLTNLVSQR
ncbi:MAG: hypothetical protein O3A80_00935 [bacterium]|nr:hypothetical protein [bacterium]